MRMRTTPGRRGYGLETRCCRLAVRLHLAASGDAVLDAARSSLRGKPGTDVSVEYKHPWETTPRTTDLKRFAVRRRDVELVTFLPSPTAPKVVAYARVGGFSRETAPELVEGLASLRFDSQKSKLEGVIIDLRGNPGGLLDAAVDVASLFLPPDAVIASAGGRGFKWAPRGGRRSHRSGETPKQGEKTAEAEKPERVEFRSRARGVTLFGVAPVVVLVDGQSASASEIVAGALQDYDAGVVVGSRTFGKGLIQDVSPLPFDGAALKVTVGRYYTPSGRCLQELDYEKERALSSKKEVSPKESFYTVNSKRPIESGGGVAPDVVVEPDTLTKAETALLRSGVANKFADDWVDKRPDVAKTLYARGLEPDADAASLVLQRSDLDSLKQRALKAIADDPDSKDGREAKREVEDAFRRHPDRILKVTDALVKERFFRSSALLKAQVSDEKAVVASMKLLSDKARFDAILAPPTKSAASAPNAVAAAGLGNAARGGGGRVRDTLVFGSFPSQVACRSAGPLRAVAGAHPRAAAVEGRAPAPGLVLADGPPLELRVRERGGAVGSNMQGMGRPSKGLIAFFVCGQARTSRRRRDPSRGPRRR